MIGEAGANVRLKITDGYLPLIRAALPRSQLIPRFNNTRHTLNRLSYYRCAGCIVVLVQVFPVKRPAVLFNCGQASLRCNLCSYNFLPVYQNSLQVFQFIGGFFLRYIIRYANALLKYNGQVQLALYFHLPELRA